MIPTIPKIKRHSNLTRKYLANIIRDDYPFYLAFVETDWFGFFCGLDKFDPYNLYIAIDTTLSKPEVPNMVQEHVINDHTVLWLWPYPKKYGMTAANFWKGNYSNMFEAKDIWRLFGEDSCMRQREVLIKSPDLQSHIEKDLNLRKGTLNDVDLEEMPKKENELFLYYLKQNENTKI